MQGLEDNFIQEKEKVKEGGESFFNNLTVLLSSIDLTILMRNGCNLSFKFENRQF